MARANDAVIVCVNDEKSCESCRVRDGEVIDMDCSADYPQATCDNDEQVAGDDGIGCRCVLRPKRKETRL